MKGDWIFFSIFVLSYYRANDSGTNKTNKTDMNMKATRIYTLLALLLMVGVLQAQTADDFWIEVSTNNDWFHHPVGHGIDTVYRASQHGVYRSVDRCETWQCIGLQDRYINILYLSEDGELYACTNDISAIHRWNGSSWDVLSYQSFTIPESFIKTSDGTLYLGEALGICKSVDNGLTWNFVWDNPDDFGSAVNGLLETSDGTLFACLTNACDYQRGVLRSTDHGVSWESVGLYDNYKISLALNSDGMVYAGCVGYNSSEDVGVFRTADNGDTWERLNGDYGVYSIVIDKNNNIFIANGDFEGLFRSNDGGYTFENISSGMDSAQTSLSLLSDGYILSYEYNLTVFFGQMFRSCESVYTSFELDVMAEPSDGGMAIGSGTYLFGERARLSSTANENYQFVGWTNQDGDTISTEPEYSHMVTRGGQITAIFVSTESLDEAEEAAIKLYPNPGGNTLNICTGLRDAWVEVYDVNGRLMHRQDITENVTGIDAGDWAEGVYVWKVISNGKLAETGKWIKE